MSGDLELARSILSAASGDRLRTDVPMAPLTTFRIGGLAALYLEPSDVGDLEAAAEAIARANVPFAILGKGSNVLVADEGFAGLVVRLGGGFRWSARAGSNVVAGGAMPLPALAGVAMRHELAGLAFGVAIPASLGGAVRMNAGAHGGEISDVVSAIDVFALRTATTVAIRGDAAGFGYRRSGLADDAVVVAATLALRPGDGSAIRAEMDAAREWRRATQPIAEPNCGSVFTNPPDGHAAAMIEAAGLKGHAIGGARVSTKHANFIIAGPGATAADVCALIAEVRDRVARTSGVELETEVRTIGGHGG